MTRSNRFTEIKKKHLFAANLNISEIRYMAFTYLSPIHSPTLYPAVHFGDWYVEPSYQKHPAMSQNRFMCIFSNSRIKIARISLTRLYNLLPGTVCESVFVNV